MAEVLRLPADRAVPWDAAVLCVGNFDGLHKGHRAIVDRAIASARSRGLPAVALTFEPHPVKMLRPDKSMTMIYPYRERYRQLIAAGVDAVVVQEFNQETAATKPEAWIRETVLGDLRAVHVVAGFDFRFGRDAAGDANFLRDRAGEDGVEVDIVAAVDNGGAKVSSSRIRRAIAAGNLEDAARWLGRPFHVDGRVVEGRRRGRTLGYPTANLETNWELVPPLGVYAGIVSLDGVRYAAGVSIGTNPTFGPSSRTIEAHLSDFDGDLYGRALALHLLARLRDEIRFLSVEELKTQMGMDMERAAAIAGAYTGGLDE